MQIKTLLQILDNWAPFSYQEDYDNSGLLIGSKDAEVTGVLVSLDLTPQIVEEAVSLGANTIISHHPILFRGLKRITDADDIVQQCVVDCIKKDINVISLHTNLDNVHNGVNAKIAEILEVKNNRILAPKSHTMSKLSYFVPKKNHEAVKQALYHAGAGTQGNYAECSFSTEGTGTFTPLEGSNPYLGKLGQPTSTPELKVEMVFESQLQSQLVSTLQEVHPYETVAYDVLPLYNTNPQVGSGMIGELETPLPFADFMERIKERFHMPYLRHTAVVQDPIQKIAFCGGAGSFLIPVAKAHGADVYLTGDMKYHDFFTSDNKITLVDMGHYEMEQYTSQLIVDYMSQKNLTFAVHLTQNHTNPIKYF